MQKAELQSSVPTASILCKIKTSLENAGEKLAFPVTVRLCYSSSGSEMDISDTLSS